MARDVDGCTRAERWDGRSRNDGDAVLSALPGPDQEGAATEAQVFDQEVKGFGDSSAR